MGLKYKWGINFYFHFSFFISHNWHAFSLSVQPGFCKPQLALYPRESLLQEHVIAPCMVLCYICIFYVTNHQLAAIFCTFLVQKYNPLLETWCFPFIGYKTPNTLTKSTCSMHQNPAWWWSITCTEFLVTYQLTMTPNMMDSLLIHYHFKTLTWDSIH